MGTTNKRYRALSVWRCAGLLFMFFLTAPQGSWAVDPAKRQSKNDDSEQRIDESRPQDEGARLPGARDRAADLNPRGTPSIRLRTHPQQWMLGVRVMYLETGARITHVFPNTPAWRVGLEPQDVIVSIDGYQIGYVNRRFYEISSELNYRAVRTGWVRLLVQNCRNDQLVNIDVRLARIGLGFPRERFDLSPDARLDQADEPSRKPRISGKLEQR